LQEYKAFAMPKFPGNPSEPFDLPQFLRGTDKRTQVMRAALTLFLKEGYSDTSMDAITAAAGVSKATVYSHFKSKDSLFAALIQEGSASVFTEFPPLERGNGTPEDDLLKFFGPILQLVISKDGSSWDRMVIAEAVRHPENARLFYSCVVEKISQLIQRYLDLILEEGLIAKVDTKLAAEAILSMAIIRPIHTLLLLGPKGLDLEPSLRFNIRLFLKGIGAKV